MDDIEKIIKKHGGDNIKGYSLINNYGYTFTLGGVRLDLRYWANCYGVALNYWRIHAINGQKTSDEQRATIKAIEDEANAIGEVDY